MEYHEFIQGLDDLPLLYPPSEVRDGDVLIAIAEREIAIHHEIYAHLETFAEGVSQLLQVFDLLPSVEGWNPLDVFGELIVELGGWAIGLPFSAWILFALFKLRGWVAPVTTYTVQETLASSDRSTIY